MTPINIFDLRDDKAMKERDLFNRVCSLMKKMTDEGKAQKEITDAIDKIELPLKMHMAAYGRFSEICKYGRVLTPSERNLFNN